MNKSMGDYDIENDEAEDMVFDEIFDRLEQLESAVYNNPSRKKLKEVKHQEPMEESTTLEKLSHYKEPTKKKLSFKKTT